MQLGKLALKAPTAILIHLISSLRRGFGLSSLKIVAITISSISGQRVLNLLRGVAAQAAVEDISLAAALDLLDYGVLQAVLNNGLLNYADALYKVVVSLGFGLVYLACVSAGERSHVINGPEVV